MGPETKLRAALAFAERGLDVFPCYEPAPTGGCTCPVGKACQDAGKHPRTSRGFKDATTDSEKVRAWWTRWPDANIGLAVGLSGLTVLDVDPRNGGDDSLKELLARVPAIGNAVRSRTGGGGAHYFFSGNRVKSRAEALGPGLDIKSDGGYVIVPPSIHPSGRAYEWDGPSLTEKLPPPIPAELAVELSEKQRAPLKLEDGEKITAGKRHDTLLRLAGAFRRKGLTPEEIAAGLAAINQARCDPPLSENEILSIARSSKDWEPAEQLVRSQGYEPLRYFEVNGEGRPRFLPAIMAKDIIKNEHAVTLRESGEVLVYKNGVYKLNGEIHIQEVAGNILDGSLNRNQMGELVEHVKWASFRDIDEFDADPYMLSVQNGLLDLRTNELRPHDPGFLTLTQIPVQFDPAKSCPAVIRFVRELVAESDVPLIQELFGYCLLRDHFLKKAFMLTGGGDNGKSILLGLLEKFLGTQNVTSLSLQQIEEDKFCRGRLRGKLANIFADLSYQALRESGWFKMLTGGDRVGFDVKFKSGGTFVSYAKLVFSANKLPEAHDDSDAFFLRWIIVNFPYTFTDDGANGTKKKRDKRELMAAFTQDEMSGLLNWALIGLRRLLERGQFSTTASTEEIRADYIRKSDSLGAFVNDCCEIDADAVTIKADFYAAYINYCDRLKLLKKSQNIVGSELPKKGIQAGRPKIGGRQEHVWLRIRVTNSPAIPANPEDRQTRLPSSIPSVVGLTPSVAGIATLTPIIARAREVESRDKIEKNAANLATEAPNPATSPQTPRQVAENLEALLRAAPGRSLRFADLLAAAASLKPPITERQVERWFDAAREAGTAFEPIPGEVQLV